MTKIIEVESEHVGHNGLRAVMFAAKAGLNTKKPFKTDHYRNSKKTDVFVFTQHIN